MHGVEHALRFSVGRPHPYQAHPQRPAPLGGPRRERAEQLADSTGRGLIALRQLSRDRTQVSGSRKSTTGSPATQSSLIRRLTSNGDTSGIV